MLVFAGIFTAINAAVIFMKLRAKRYADAVADVSILSVLSAVFAGSLGGLVITTTASAMLSVFFYFHFY